MCFGAFSSFSSDFTKPNPSPRLQPVIKIEFMMWFSCLCFLYIPNFHLSVFYCCGFIDFIRFLRGKQTENSENKFWLKSLMTEKCECVGEWRTRKIQSHCTIRSKNNFKVINPRISVDVRLNFTIILITQDERVQFYQINCKFRSQNHNTTQKISHESEVNNRSTLQFQ